MKVEEDKIKTKNRKKEKSHLQIRNIQIHKNSYNALDKSLEASDKNHRVNQRMDKIQDKSKNKTKLRSINMIYNRYIKKVKEYKVETKHRKREKSHLQTKNI